MRFKLWVWILAGLAFISTARAQADSWTNLTAGTFKWETGSNWSLGVPPSAGQVITITNRVVAAPHENRQKTIEIDSTTASSFPGTLSISDLTVSAPFGNQNTLLMNDTGSTALNIEHSLTISNHGIVSIVNSVVEMGIPNGTLSVDGTLLLNGGSLTTVGEAGTAQAIVGNTGVGQMTVLDGIWRTATLSVGNAAGSQGTLVLAGGTTELNGPMSIGLQPGSAGAIWLTGGQLTSIINVFNSFDAFIGAGGVGQMTVSNGMWFTRSVFIGSSGVSGTLTVDGGTSTVYSNLLVGSSGCTGTGALMIDGGSLFVTNAAHTGTLVVNKGGVTVSGTGLLNTEEVVATNPCPANLLITGSGAVWQNRNDLLLGGATNSDSLIISNGGLFVDIDSAAIGWSSTSPNNHVIVTGSGSVWSNGFQLFLGTLSGGNSMVISAGGVALNSNGVLGANSFSAGNNTVLVTDSGSVWNSGTLTLGNFGQGNSLMISNGGAVVSGTAELGANAQSVNNLAIVTGSGSVWSNSAQLSVGFSSTGNSLVIRGGGTVTDKSGFVGVNAVGASNNNILVADSGSAWDSDGVSVGQVSPGNSLVISNGGAVVSRTSFVGQTSSSGNNSVVITGSGSSWSTNSQLFIGEATGGNSVTVTNGGTLMAVNVTLGRATHGEGTLTLAAGGTALVSANMTLGNLICTGTGIVEVTGGSLYVTNSTGNAVLEVSTGTFVLNSGTVVVDRFIMTNACAHFVRTGGTLIYGTAVLSSALDADGDGIPNGYEKTHGLDPLNPADAALDNDGDGFSNLQEFLAGTDPNNAGSTPFVAVAVANQGNNVVLTWTTLGGTTNQVQVANGGFATNAFVNLGAPLNISGVGLVTTNYTDVGGATNSTGRFYRVRLVP